MSGFSSAMIPPCNDAARGQLYKPRSRDRGFIAAGQSFHLVGHEWLALTDLNAAKIVHILVLAPLKSVGQVEWETLSQKFEREDHGIARRANARLTLDDGKSCQEIAKFLYLVDDTIRGWYTEYKCDGWDALARDGWQGGLPQRGGCQGDSGAPRVSHPPDPASDVLPASETGLRTFMAGTVPRAIQRTTFTLKKRLRAVMHQQLTHNRHYATRKQFTNAVPAVFRETIPRKWKPFRGQISDNFRVITHEAFWVSAG